MDLTKFNDDQLAKLWHTAYDSIDEMEKGLKASIPYVTAREIIAGVETILTQRLHDSGASSIATPSGTIHTVGRTTAKIMDPEKFREYVVNGQRWDMLDWKANMSACRDVMEKTHDVVPGVELSTYRNLSITSPKKGKPHVD